MKNGFTLLELLVVVLIVGILMAAAMPIYSRSVEKSRLTEPKWAINKLKGSIGMCSLTYSPAGSADWTANCASSSQLDDAEISGTVKTSGCFAGTKCVENTVWQYNVGSQIYVVRMPSLYYLAYPYYSPSNSNPPISCYDIKAGECDRVCGGNGCSVE